MRGHRHLAMLAAVAALGIAAVPQTAAAQQQERRADLADAVAGTYYGDVISDARGSSQSGVTVTVTRVGPNLVEVSADYDRIPTVRIPLSQAMSAILQARGDNVFLIDRSRDPGRLSLTIDDASLSVERQRN